MQTVNSHTPEENLGLIEKWAPAFSLVHDIQIYLIQNPSKSFIAYAIDLAIKNGRPDPEIIKTLKDIAADNRSAVAEVIGLVLLDRVLVFWIPWPVFTGRVFNYEKEKQTKKADPGAEQAQWQALRRNLRLDKKEKMKLNKYDIILIIVGIIILSFKK